MTRFALNVTVVLALALTVSACGYTSQTGPTDVPRPINAPHSNVEFTLYHGDPTCLMGCQGPSPAVKLVSDYVRSAGDHTYSATVKSGERLVLKGIVYLPVVAGHVIARRITNHAKQGPAVIVYDPITTGTNSNGGKNAEAGFRDGFYAKTTPGVYSLEIMVEETGTDLSSPVVIRIVIQVTITE